MKFYYVTNIFDRPIFDNEMTALLKFCKCIFVSLAYLNERNITASCFMIHLKLMKLKLKNDPLVQSNFKLHKPAILKLRFVEYTFILSFTFIQYFRKTFRQKPFEKTIVSIQPTGQIYVRVIFVEHSYDIFPEYLEKVPYEIP